MSPLHSVQSWIYHINYIYTNKIDQQTLRVVLWIFQVSQPCSPDHRTIFNWVDRCNIIEAVVAVCLPGIPTAMLEPTRPLPTLPSRRTHSTSNHGRPSRPARPPSGDRPALPGNGKPNICDGNFNTVAFFRREMFVFKVSREGRMWHEYTSEVRDTHCRGPLKSSLLL